MDKPHTYYTSIPTLQQPQLEPGRDGVPPEEDLALRALLPECRPKRGRRKVEEKDAEDDLGLSPVKRPRVDTSLTAADFDNFGGTMFPSSILPATPSNGDVDRYVKNFDPWAPVSTPPLNTNLSTQAPAQRSVSAFPSGQQHRWRINNWRVNTQDNGPSTPHPQSAINPTSTPLPFSGFPEPMSAITPGSSGSRGKAKRRHGPAVSSAWPSLANPLTGKFRGRPPSNRSVRDGPFSTFPANPKVRESKTIEFQNHPAVSSLLISRTEHDISTPPAMLTPQLPHSAPQRQALGRKIGLHLQVPDRVSGAVQPATPSFMLNGKSARQSAPTATLSEEGESDTEGFLTNHRQPDTFNGHAMTTLLKYLTARIMTADFLEGTSVLEMKLAKRLAEQSVEMLRSTYDDAVDEEELAAVCALWFGLAQDLDMQLGARSSMHELKVRPTTSHVSMDGLASTNGRNGSMSSADHGQGYVMSWRLSMGPLSGSFSLPINLSREIPALGSVAKDDMIGLAGEDDWQQKFMALKKEKEEEMRRIRRSVVHVLF